MLEYLKLKGFDQAVYLYWGVRSKADLYMDYLPKDWMNRYPQFKYIPVLSEPKPEDHWQGRIGWVHEAVVSDFPDLSAYQVYMSGPPPMILAGREAFLAHGLHTEHLYSDSFDYSSDTLKALTEKQK
jgi:CDP-4-dehydro-6-deoxyglucose reductase